MRNFLIVLGLLASLRLFACDYCGGGGLGLDANVLSANNGNSIGLINMIRQYDFSNGETDFNSTLVNWTIAGSYSPHKKVELKALLPLLLNIDHLYGRRSKFGLGDMPLIATYTAFKSKENTTKKVKHLLKLSSGIELPTGNANVDAERSIAIPFGSKSVDFIFGGAYVFSVKKYSMATSTFSKVNTKNRDNYSFGNGVEALWQHVLKFKAKDGWLFPSTGLKYNWQNNDTSNGFTRVNTGGQFLSATVGLQWDYYKHKLLILTEMPFYQNVNNQNVDIGNTLLIQYIFTIPKK